MNQSPQTLLDEAILEDEAIAWFVVLKGTEGEARRAEFTQWQARSPAHAAAYARIARVHEEAAILRHSHRFGPARSAPDKPKIRHALRWAVPAGVFIATALIGLALHDRPNPDADPASRQILSSARGEIRAVRLADGSTVTLDTASRVEVRFDGAARHLALLQGRARFALVDDGRPFAVAVGGQEITGRRALFDVHADGPDSEATLWNGEARSRPLWHNADYTGNGETLQPGVIQPLGLQHHRHGSRDALGSRDWPSGWVEYRALPLATLAEVVNSYGGTPLVLDDASAAGQLVSGRFRVTDPAAVASRLGDVFDLSVTRRDNALHLATRK